MSSSTATNPDGCVLLPESRVRYKLPLNLKDEDLWLFELGLEWQIPETRLLQLKNVNVSDDGLLFKKGRVLKESFAFQHLFDAWKSRKLEVAKFFAKNYLLQHTTKFGRDALWISDDWSGGYFHWLADALPRLCVVRDHLTDSVLLLPNRYQQFSFVEPSLTAFGVHAFEYLSVGEVRLCRNLVVPTHVAPSGHYNFDVINMVRRALLDCCGNATEGATSERVYISRSNVQRRRIQNEEDVMQVLREFGFMTVRTEEMSFAEQVALFSRTRFLLSNHGAGLTNMLFMNEGSSVLELRHEQDNINNCYFRLASPLNLKYYYQTCEAMNVGEDPHMADLIVDTAQLQTTLKELLKA